jgi:hypothetical protein
LRCRKGNCGGTHAADLRLSQARQAEKLRHAGDHRIFEVRLRQVDFAIQV